MCRSRPKSAVPDISFSLDVDSPVASRSKSLWEACLPSNSIESFVEKIATSSSNQQDRQLTVSSTVVRNLPQIDTDELDNILHQSDQNIGAEKSYGGAVDIENFAGNDQTNRAPLLRDQHKRPRRPRSQSRPRSTNPMKTVAHGESSYSEQKTDLAIKMCQGKKAFPKDLNSTTRATQNKKSLEAPHRKRAASERSFL